MSFVVHRGGIVATFLRNQRRGHGVGLHMGQTSGPGGVRQLRLTVHAEDYEQAVAFYRDTLGLPVELHVESEGGAEVMILDAGRATLELCNTAQVELIDEVEVGRRVSPKFRLALEVTDTAGTTRRALEAGAELVAEPTRTPWDSLNSRLETPGGIQLTLFEELDA